jgi:hypothetical protein
MQLGWTYGDDPNVLPSIAIDDSQQAAGRAQTESDETPFSGVGLVVRDRDGVRIVKNRDRFGHANAMLAEVDSGLALLVPLELHDSLPTLLYAHFVQTNNPTRSLRAVYRGFGFPGANDLGNMFQFDADFEKECLAARSVNFSTSLNPALHNLDVWVVEIRVWESRP